MTDLLIISKEFCVYSAVLLVFLLSLNVLLLHVSVFKNKNLRGNFESLLALLWKTEPMPRVVFSPVLKEGFKAEGSWRQTTQ